MRHQPEWAISLSCHRYKKAPVSYNSLTQTYTQVQPTSTQTRLSSFWERGAAHLLPTLFSLLFEDDLSVGFGRNCCFFVGVSSSGPFKREEGEEQSRRTFNGENEGWVCHELWKWRMLLGFRWRYRCDCCWSWGCWVCSGSHSWQGESLPLSLSWWVCEVYGKWLVFFSFVDYECMWEEVIFLLGFMWALFGCWENWRNERKMKRIWSFLFYSFYYFDS